MHGQENSSSGPKLVADGYVCLAQTQIITVRHEQATLHPQLNALLGQLDHCSVVQAFSKVLVAFFILIIVTIIIEKLLNSDHHQSAEMVQGNIVSRIKSKGGYYEGLHLKLSVSDIAKLTSQVSF